MFALFAFAFAIVTPCVVVLATIALGGCAAVPQCVRSAACGAAAVCRPDGTCGALALDAVTRGAHATWLAPMRVALRGTTDDGEAITLGPSSTVLLSFSDLPIEDAPVGA